MNKIWVLGVDGNYYRLKEITKENITQQRQNRLHYIVDDFAALDIPKHITKEILLARGVNKWFANRKKLIELKHQLKELTRTYLGLILVLKKNISDSRNKIQGRTGARELEQIRGAIELLVIIRKDIDKICKSERWMFPE